MGEKTRETLKLRFDKRLRLEFHGARITSDAGLLAFRELDGVLGTDQSLQFNDRVAYEISLSHPHLPASKAELHWFQHAFGMWGGESPFEWCSSHPNR